MNKPIGFDDKLKHSIELLQKAEKLALRYDPENGFFNTFCKRILDYPSRRNKI